MAEAGTIDSLQIEIEASSKSAAEHIDKLATALGKLKREVGSTATDLSKWAVQIKTFAETTKNIDGSSASAIAKIADALKSLSGIGKISIPKNIGERIGEIGKGLKSFKSIKPEAVNSFATMVQALHGLDGLDSEAIKSFSKLKMPEISRSAANGITRIAKAISEIDDDSVERIRNFADAMSGLAGVDFSGLAALEKLDMPEAPKGGGSAWASFAKSIANEAKKAIQFILNLAKALGKTLVNAAVNAGKAMANFAKSIVAAPFQKLASRVKTLNDKFHNLISSFKRVLFYRAVRTVIKELGDAMKEGEENAYWYTKTIGDATHYIAEAYDTFASASATMKNQVGAAWATLFANIEPLITQIIVMVQRAAEVVTMFFAKLGGKNTYLKAIDYSKDWAEETDKGAKAAKEWRNQLMAFDEINRLEAPTDSTSGKGSGTDKDYGAMFVEQEVDHAIGDLADRLRESWESQDWKGLGELIVQTLNDLFPSRDKWEKWGAYLGNGIDGIIKTSYYALRTIDFSEWGSRMADGLNAAMDEIDFYTAGQLFVRNFTALLDLVGSFLRGLDYHDLGKAIGDYFRGALDEATVWLRTHDWSAMSAALWEKIQALVYGFDVPTFAQRLGDFITTAANSAADFLNGLDFTDVVNTVTSTIATFFDNLGIDNIKTAISNLWKAIQTAFIDAMNAFGEWLRNKDWAEIGASFNATLQNMLDGMLAMVESVPWYDIGHSIGEFLAQIDWIDVLKKFAEGLWTAFSGIISGLLDTKTGKVIVGFIAGFEALKLLFTGVKAFAIFEAAKLFVGGIAGAGGLGALIPALGSVVAGIGTALAPIASVIFSPTGLIIGAVIAATVLIVKNWDEIKEAAGKLKEKLAEDWENLKESASQTWSNIKETVSDKWNELKENASTTWESIKTTVSEKWDTLKSEAETTWEAVKTGVSAKWDEIKEKASTVWDNVKQSISGSWESITSTTSTVWDGITGTVSSAWDGIKGIASTAWGGVKDAVTGATSDISTDSKTDTQTLYNDVTGIYNNLHSEAVRVFSDIGRAVPQIMNYLAQEVQNSVQEMSNAMQQMGNDIESAISSISSLDWSIPAPKIPHIDVWYDVVYNGDGSSFNIPQFDVQWYAKGGILKDATLFGMGDAGAEALVPLERNTEWIGKVAAEMNRQSAKNEGRDESNDDVIDALYTICDRIIRAIPDGGDELDMDSLARALTKVQRRQARAMG